jgi:dipeptidyl aminopeptidase/acylaminoacyl peptidase
MRRFVFVFVLLMAGVVTASGSEGRGFSVEDLVRMDRISGPQTSPDGEWVVFVKRHTDMDADRGRTDLWLMGTDGEGIRQLTSDPAGDSSPVWSPDSQSVYFLSSRSESSQVWRIPSTGGEAQQVTDSPLDVTGFLLSPGGEQLALTLEVFPDCPTLECTVELLEERETSPASGHLYDRIFARHWDSWKDGRRSHLFVMPSAGGEIRDLIPGMDADVPSKPFGGSEEVTFTADGKGLVFTMRDVGSAEPWSTDFDLYFVPVDGSAPPRCLTESNDAWDSQPVFSPSGKTLAYLAMARPGFEADRFRIVLMSWPEGKIHVLTQDWDYSAGGVVFSEDGETVFTTAADRGQVSLFAIDLNSGIATRLVGEGHVRSPSLAGDRIVFGLDTLESPVDLYWISAKGGPIERLTEVNADRLADVEMGKAQQFTFEGWNGDTVHAYVVEPVNLDPEKKYPVAFLIHGGPQGSFGNDFHYRWNPQTYTGAGYGTVMVDFHGSTGYGQDFTDSISGDWGGKPLEDLQKGLAAALKRYAWLDGDRVCALGASYGGYMINWIAGNWPDGFQCLVNHDGVFDNRMMYFATEELWFPEWEHGGPYWANPEGHENHNPANHVENWTTPMLVVHGELDYRIPVTQGLAAFTALQRRGVPSEFLYFPDENHWVLRPSNSVLWHETVLTWMDRWLENQDE